MRTVSPVRVPTCRVCLAIALIAAAQSPIGVLAEIPKTADWPAVKVIDVHTHIFNARDLPLVGVLNALGAPRKVAEIAAWAMNKATPKDDKEPRREVSMNLVERPEIEDLSEPDRETLLDYVGRNRQAPLRAAAEFLRVKPDVTLLAETLAKIGFPPDERVVAYIVIRKLVNGTELGKALRGYVRFIGIMTRQHGEIVAALRHTYPQVDLFVHHMMDMQWAYDDRPQVDFSDQIVAMQKVDRAFPGTVLHFSAFDPIRRASAVPLAERAVKDYSAVGLKVYPPSGYRAAKNAFYKFPSPRNGADKWEMGRWKSRYEPRNDNWSESKLDGTLQDAFFYAAKERVPLFTHCTPGGFEAVRAQGNVPGYGMMADPFFWASVLSRSANKGLRLCFGHSGGEAYWFSDPANDPVSRKNKPPGDPWQFGNQVVDLCLTYPDVYCEVGYLDGVLDPKQAAVLVRRLQSVIDLPSKDGKWRFGEKLMYGTDWHMIYKVPELREISREVGRCH